MSKPILIVKFPHDAAFQDLEAASTLMTNKGIELDYHILIIHDFSNNEGIKFECFNAPHTDIEFNELKDRVLSLIKNK